MAIKSIHMENFTVFENMMVELSSGINIFIGENSTGKTHLLKALYAYCECEILETYELADKGCAWIDNYSSKLTEYFQMQGDLGDIRLRRSISNNNPENKIATVNVESCFGIHHFCLTVVTPPIDLAPKGSKDRLVKKIIPSVFIPAKEMLTHARGLRAMSKKHSKDMPFDKTLLDIIENAEHWKVDNVPEIAEGLIPLLEDIIEGKIILRDGDFYVVKSNGDMIPFYYEAEGVKKFGLLWQLLMSEVITNDTMILFCIGMSQKPTLIRS